MRLVKRAGVTVAAMLLGIVGGIALLRIVELVAGEIALEQDLRFLSLSHYLFLYNHLHQ